MRQLTIYVITIFLFIACGNSINENLVEAYKEILIINETVQDSAKAELLISKIYKKYGYSEETFREEFFETAKDNKKEFMLMLDTIRNRILREYDLKDSVLKKSRN